MSSNATSLRRSCQACAKVKRRCDLSFPKCSRCSTKGLTCEYINIPLTAGAKTGTTHCRDKKRNAGHEWHMQGNTFGHPQNTRSTRESACPRLHIRYPLQVEIIKTRDRAIIRYLVNGMRCFPVMLARDTKTPFFHPHLYGSFLPAPVRDIHAVCDLYVAHDRQHMSGSFFLNLRLKITDLLIQAKHSKSFEGLLACVQALILAQCIWLFDGDEDERLAVPANDMLVEFAQRLWQQAPVQLPNCLSPWRAWLLAESVRRTVIISHVLQGTYSLARRKYSIRTPFVDALPFDVRTSLWEAQSEEAWEEAAFNAQLPLVSLHEYTDILEIRPVLEGSLFEGLILAACKGKETSSSNSPIIAQAYGR
ncbi:transcription factor gsfR2 [Lipomyces orientalis]|uniref:Transcription factor gsfR2 n=1 Tax=Lipomyces orientalis TaxID=1233043 RepID=A0ACC3TN82_9ASCO